jgi:dihydrofolate synthase/folylpolyglutamate synthase
MLFNILKELGYTTGRYISPYVENFTERISMNNGDISKAELIFNFEFIKGTLLNKKVPKDMMPNEFEFITLMAFVYYKQMKCEVVVLETGLGGRLDPTNVVKSPLASVIASVSFDHMELLGDTIEKIAKEKAGIVKENSTVVLYPINQPEVVNIVESTAKEKNSNLVIPDLNSLKIFEETIDYSKFEYKNQIYKIKLAGRHQIYNAITAIETALYLYRIGKIKIKNSGLHDLSHQSGICTAINKGLENTFFPARFEILSKNPLIIFDGAHNYAGINALQSAIKNLMPDKKIIFICGMMKDKNPQEAIKEICADSCVEKFILVPVDSSRSSDPKEICDAISEYSSKVEYGYNILDILFEIFKELEQDKDRENKAVVCFGSIYLASPVKHIWHKYKQLGV